MEKLAGWLKQHRITEVECVIPDLTGIARGKIMPCGKFCNEQGIRLPEGVLTSTVTGDYLPDEAYKTLIDPAEIDMVLKPDESAVFKIPWAVEPTAQIIHDCYDKSGNPVSQSPRNVLKKVLALYEAKNWEPVIAPELEFFLTQRCTNPDLPLEPPIGRSGRKESGRQSYSIDATNEYDPLFEDIYSYCDAQGLDIDTLVHEEGIAQMEINFRHGHALSLADQVFTFKRSVREAALKHKVTATFMAKPVENEPGSSMHLHQSIIDKTTGKNIFNTANNGPSTLFMHFLGGLQKYVPMAMPLFAPNVNSYRRFLPGESAPVNVSWGIDNRTVAFRVPEATSEARRVENRLAGADANPYLAIAATLLCGYMGIEEKCSPEEAVTGSAYGLRSQRIPTNLEAALEMMESCQALTAMLGETFVDTYIAVKRAEYENFKRVISSWEREYLLLTV